MGPHLKKITNIADKCIGDGQGFDPFTICCSTCNPPKSSCIKMVKHRNLCALLPETLVLIVVFSMAG